MSDLGNTKTKSDVESGKKQALQYKKYCFTLNNYSKEDIKEIEIKFKEISIKYVFQEETGEEGTPHLQGVVLLKDKMRWTEFNLNKKIHWEQCKDLEASIKYCQKEESRTGETFKFGFPKEIKIIKDLKPWQKEIEDLIINNEPDGRTLNWYYESKGGVGKSVFCKYMYVKHGIVTIQGGKLADIMNIIFNLNMDEVKGIFIDVPRNNGNKISYNSVECILNGMITNTKFETGVKVFNPPHVVVFCNYPPQKNTDCLSEDRWNIKEIS